MNYRGLMMNTKDLRQEATSTIQALEKRGYTPAIIGGVLRVEELGGCTSDIDVAIRLPPAMLMQCAEVLHDLGYECIHINKSKYSYTSGFLADFRMGNVNVILYNSYKFGSLRELVSSFDLNINMYFEEIDMYGEYETYNTFFNGQDVLYTPHPMHVPKPERIERFYKEYPELNWSRVQHIQDLLELEELFSE